MKKITPDPPVASAACDSLDLDQLSEASHRIVSKRLRNPNHADPICHVFTILPDVDTETLLCHACETLASLNVLTTDGVQARRLTTQSGVVDSAVGGGGGVVGESGVG